MNLKGITFSVFNKRNRELPILRKVDLLVKKGEMHLITGPSGSGKTTLLQIIGTILHQTEGERQIFNEMISNNPSIEKLTKTRAKIGYLFQSPYLPAELTAKEFIELQTSLADIGLSTAEKRAKEIFQEFKIENLLNEICEHLSGGEKQRIALASILTKDIELLLLDEPTGSLDYDNRVKVWELILDLKRKGLTIIIVSHDESIKEIVDVSHRLRNGLLIEE